MDTSFPKDQVSTKADQLQVHFLEKDHNDRFRELMDRFMPQWRLHRDELNRAPLAHEEWRY